MDETFLLFSDVYGSVQLGTVPCQDFWRLASTINSSIENVAISDMPSSSAPPENSATSPGTACISHRNTRLALLVLSIVDKMSARLLDVESSRELRLFISDVFRVLLEEFSFLTNILRLFGDKDRLLSHLAAKCATSLIRNELEMSESQGVVLLRMEAEIFQVHSSCHLLDSSMWTLTTVLKDELKANMEQNSECVGRLLSWMDGYGTSLYSYLLQNEVSNRITDWNITLTTFMDLLEALIAARYYQGTCVSSQRLLFTQTPAFLQLLASSADYFVKKRALLLLKRTLLRKAGEDWLSGAEKPSNHCDPHFADDICALTKNILVAVDCDWLQHVPVRTSPCFFGGNLETFLTGIGDNMMLRAVSLVVLKSLEYQTHGADSKSEYLSSSVLSYLKNLLLFVKQHCAEFRNASHPCLFVSLVFGDQDDDMMEAARALLNLQIHHKRFAGPPETNLCDVGLNPHCHFVLLLRGLAFDHSVLLDFLISSETCFLEYMICYLKLLRGDWEGFHACCHLLDTSGRKGTETGSQAALPPVAPWSCSNEGGPEDVGFSGRSAQPHLVDYASSEDSGEEAALEGMEEEMDVCASTSESALGAVAQPQEGGRGKVAPFKEAPEASVASQDLGQCTQQSAVSQKALLCLQELRTVVSRLQQKNLFPYNPTSLLRLLLAVEDEGGLC